MAKHQTVSLAILATWSVETLRALLPNYQGADYTEQNQADALRAEKRALLDSVQQDQDAANAKFLAEKKAIREKYAERLANVVKSPAAIMVQRIQDVIEAKEAEARENRAA